MLSVCVLLLVLSLVYCHEQPKCCDFYEKGQKFCSNLDLSTKHLFKNGIPLCNANEALFEFEYAEHSNDSISSVIEEYRGNGSYCLNIKENYVVILICLITEPACAAYPCLKKCCPPGEFLENKICSPARRPFKPELESLGLNFGIIDNSYNCQFNEKYFIGDVNGSVLLKNQTISHPDEEFSVEEYCIDDVLGDELDGHFVFGCFSGENEEIRINVKTSWKHTILSIALIISNVFFLITLVVYWSLSKMNKLYPKLLISYVSSLFVAYLVLSINIILSQDIYQMPFLCQTMGFVQHFSFLAGFCWLNVLCVDIWRTITIGQSRSTQGFKFRWCVLFALGVPGCITTLVMLVEFGVFEINDDLKPSMVKECWFTENNHGIWLFFFGPTSISVTCNILCFILTTVYYIRIKQNITRMTLKNEQPSQASVKRRAINFSHFLMSIKLFTVMGIAWTMEIVSFTFRNSIRDEWWYVTDLFNALHGVFLFIIFVMKPKVLVELKIKLGYSPGPETSYKSTLVSRSVQFKKCNSQETGLTYDSATPPASMIKRKPSTISTGEGRNSVKI